MAGRAPSARTLAATLLLLAIVPAALRGETLRVGTYNLENYTVATRQVDGRFRPDFPKPEKAKAALREVIRQLDADVLAVQEIGGPGYLEELRLDLKAEGLDYPYGHVLVAADEARRIGVLSKRPLLEVTDHTDLTLPYFGETLPVKRGLLEISVSSGEGRLTLFVVHLKSRITEREDDPGSAQQRAGEAVAVRDCVLARRAAPDVDEFLILGDFNELRPNRPMRALLDRGKTMIAEWLPAADSRGETWTHYYARDEVYSRVDHILASPAAARRVKRAWIVDAPATRQASDHRPVAVELVW